MSEPTPGLRELLRGVPVFPQALPVLDPERAPDDPVALFLDWLALAIDAGVPAPHAPVLATAGPHGPTARTLILKDLDADGGWLFATHRTSPKGRDLAATPAAALVFSWLGMGRQIRVTGAVEQAPSERSALDFRERPLPSRAAALVGRQSEPMDDPAAYDAAFAAAEARLRAEPDLVDPEWTLFRLAAGSVEFWQASHERAHVRLRYRRGPGGWRRERLWP